MTISRNFGLTELDPFERICAAIALVAVLAMGGVLLSKPGVTIETADHHALATMVETQNTTVSCLTTTTTIAPQGAVAMCVQNSSATCIHLGGSTVTSASGDGIEVGSGCAGGQLFCADARRMYCAASAPTTATILYGAQ
jgi:hypothetical protein